MKKLTISLFLSLFLFSSNIFADDVLDAHKLIQKVNDAIVNVDDKKKLTALIEESIDFEWISRFVLGREYRKFTNEQKKEFTDLYRKFLIKTYGPKFNNYQAESYEILLVQEKKRYSIVKSKFKINDGSEVNFAFRVKKGKDSSQFKIIDIIVETVSLIETQRSEFSSVIKEVGIDNFLMAMKKKTNNKENAKE
jgi:phospholipid transport system substrate-binding protein|tara:strand:+ start:1300 stop:1881 length:582 start_codon:yes stop_codon:yes gene_type:complete